MNIFMLLYIQHFIHVITSLVQKIDQSLNYAIQNGLTVEKTMEQYLATVLLNKQKLPKNSEHYKRSTLTINEFELIPITDKYKFVSKKVPQKRLDQQQKS